MALQGIHRTCKKYGAAKTPRGVELRCEKYEKTNRKNQGVPPKKGKAITNARIYGKTRQGKAGVRDEVCRHPAGPIERTMCHRAKGDKTLKSSSVPSGAKKRKRAIAKAAPRSARGPVISPAKVQAAAKACETKKGQALKACAKREVKKRTKKVNPKTLHIDVTPAQAERIVMQHGTRVFAPDAKKQAAAIRRAANAAKKSKKAVDKVMKTEKKKVGTQAADKIKKAAKKCMDKGSPTQACIVRQVPAKRTFGLRFGRRTRTGMQLAIGSSRRKPLRSRTKTTISTYRR